MLRRALLLMVNLAALLGVAPVYGYLELPAQVAYPLAVVAGFCAARGGRKLLNDRFATLLSIGLFLFYALQLSSSHFVEPVVNLLVLLLAVRLVGDASPRHLLQIFVLALFTLAASSLLSLSMAFFACLLLQVPLITVGLVLLCFHAKAPQLQLDRRGWRLVLLPALLLPAGSLLLMVFFYAILPRTDYPLWGFLNPVGKAQVGFADEVRPGSFSALAATDAIAFRVETIELPAEQLYWRTIVLNQTDGIRWKRQGTLPMELPPQGETVAQLIYLEPRTDRFLPLLDTPVQLSGAGGRTNADLVQTASRSLQRRTRYRAESRPGGSSRLQQPGRAERYLQLPAALSPRLQKLAAEVSRQPGRAERVTKLQEIFRRLQLRYSSERLPQTSTPIETFLFDSHRGYCEYFASSFALLLRQAGVPARLVGGFLGGSYNQLGGYYLVSEETAHVWVEVLLEDGRWRRVDPSRLAINAASELLGRHRGQLSMARLLADSLNHVWNQAVISYDFHRQLDLLRAAGRQLHQPSWRPGTLTWALLLVALLPGLAWLVWRRRQTPLQRLQQRLLKAITKRYGPQQVKRTGLVGLAQQLGDGQLEQLAQDFSSLLYTDKDFKRGDLRQLQQQLRRWQRGQDFSGD